MSELVRAAEEAAATRSEAGLADYERALREGKDDRLQRQLPCCGFLVPAPVWQAALLYRVVEVPSSMALEMPSLSFDSIVADLEDCIHPAFRETIPKPVAKALRERLPGKLPPRDAIDHYVHYLMGEGYLCPDGIGGFTYTSHHAAWLDREHRKIQREAERRRTADRAIGAILAAVPDDERAGFSVSINGADRRMVRSISSEKRWMMP